MTAFAWLDLLVWVTSVLLLLVAAAAVASTRVTRLERPVRAAVVVVEVVAALVVVVDLGLVLRADPSDRPTSLLTHLGYAVAAVGLVPALVRRPPPGGGSDGSPTSPGPPHHLASADAELPEPVSPWAVAVALAAAAVCLVRLSQTR